MMAIELRKCVLSWLDGCHEECSQDGFSTRHVDDLGYPVPAGQWLQAAKLAFEYASSRASQTSPVVLVLALDDATELQLDAEWADVSESAIHEPPTLYMMGGGQLLDDVAGEEYRRGIPTPFPGVAGTSAFYRVWRSPEALARNLPEFARAFYVVSRG